jgi:hypothetical protein
MFRAPALQIFIQRNHLPTFMCKLSNPNFNYQQKKKVFDGLCVVELFVIMDTICLY